jgi:ABC-type phosphate transport system permease subunit
MLSERLDNLCSRFNTKARKFFIIIFEFLTFFLLFLFLLYVFIFLFISSLKYFNNKNPKLSSFLTE